MSRQRLEDLGRILVLLDQILDHPLFENNYRDEMCDYFLPKSVIQNEDNEQYLERFAQLERYIASVKSSLFECLDICKGEDVLNRDEDL